jgi:hypothetical protein
MTAGLLNPFGMYHKQPIMLRVVMFAACSRLLVVSSQIKHKKITFYTPKNILTTKVTIIFWLVLPRY